MSQPRILRGSEVETRPAQDEPVPPARPRFAWNMGEVSGALGDLGTFLPHIIGAITTGLGNLLAAPFGGDLMCHGAGGIAGHVRFGARTATAPVLIGLVFVALGLLLGESGYALLRTIPDSVLGGLLLFSGMELALSSRLHQYQRGDLFLVLLMAAIGVGLNPAAAFAVGLPIAYALERGWIRI